MVCIHCQEEILPARLEALPETKTCVNCSDVKPYRALISGSAKSKNFEVHIIPADSPVNDYVDEQGQRGYSSTDDE